MLSLGRTTKACDKAGLEEPEEVGDFFFFSGGPLFFYVFSVAFIQYCDVHASSSLRALVVVNRTL